MRHLASFARPSRPCSWVFFLFAAVVFASPLHAQSVAGAADPPSTEHAAQATAAAVPPGFWELIGGFEADSHKTSYGFFGPSHVQPFKPGLAWTFHVFGNHLYYAFPDRDGEVSVTSPGISTQLGLRFGDHNTFKIGAGPAVKWKRRELKPLVGPTVETAETIVGATFGADFYASPTSHNAVQGILSYGTADKYTWGMLNYKEQLSNRTWQGPMTTYLGAEGIGQGNKDIRSMQFGGFFEVLHVKSGASISFASGYKRSMFDVGPDKTGPYFHVNYYQRLKT